MKYVDIIVPLAVDGVFSYSVPVHLQEVVRKGSLVIVPLKGKKYTGVVYQVHDKEPIGYKTRPIDSVIEKDISFSDRHLQFLLWISEYYMSFPGEVMRAALPVIFRLESYTSITLAAKEIDYSQLTEEEDTLLRFLNPGQYTALKEIDKALKLKNSLRVVRNLIQKGYVEIREIVDEAFKEKKEKYIVWRREFSETELTGILDSLKRARSQYNMLSTWIFHKYTKVKRHDFLQEHAYSPAALKALCDKGILMIVEEKSSRLDVNTDVLEPAHLLTDKQNEAYREINHLFGTQNTVLFQGVTSSGKTEIYIHLIQQYIREGKQVLYMLPEIALTVQIIKRLKRVFGDAVGVYHSGMSDVMRAEVWKKQNSDKPYQLILGVRSSIFLPYSDLGLVIIDEEHDSSYKQKEPSPRYNGRDSAIMLATLYGAKVLLGSATPSFESYEHAKIGKYGHVKLGERYGDIQMPDLSISDLSEYKRKKLMQGSFSPDLVKEMKRNLDKGNQVILFQNRKGYSTYLQCDSCGKALKCKHCDVSLTYYKHREVLSCRYCGTIRQIENTCEDCGQGTYKLKTPGTERIEEEVQTLFPKASIERLDLETTTSKTKLHSIINDFETGKTNILVGTQMVTKGLDFGNVKLVGVINADSMINFPDFRAQERAFCMLMQVSGRSGRKGSRGKVVIQADDVKNPMYKMLAGENYDALYAELITERKEFSYPPYSRLILVEIRHKDLITVRNAANTLAQQLRTKLGKRVNGPAVPEVGRMSGYYRIHILLKVETNTSASSVKKMIREDIRALENDKSFTGLRIFCDVDP